MTYENIIKNINILLADDDEDYLLMTYTFLKQLGYNVDKVTDGKKAIEALNSKDYQIALLDYFMPGLNGEEVIQEIRKTNKQLIIILQTGFSGQKPPIETMQTLNIQNYFDKTEGIDRLNLELISAVKIFKQQNEIELSKYKQNAIGNLISGIAQEMKADLLSVSASIELANMVLKDKNTNVEQSEVEKLNTFYNNSKETLSNIDKILTSLISQSGNDNDYVIDGNEAYKLIKLILKNIAKERQVDFETNISLRPNSYIKGDVNDIIFLTSEILSKIIEQSNKGDAVKFSLTEDEENWLFEINSENISKLQNSFTYLLRMLVISIENCMLNIEENKIVISLKK